MIHPGSTSLRRVAVVGRGTAGNLSADRAHILWLCLQPGYIRSGRGRGGFWRAADWHRMCAVPL